MKNKAYKDIGLFIKHKRQELGLTQEELGGEIDVSPPTISLYESGERKPELGQLRKIANALKVSFAELMGISASEKDLNIALRSEKLTLDEIGQVKNYIEFLRHERRKKKTS